MIDLTGKDILDGAQFTRDEIEAIMALADEFRGQLEKTRGLDLLKGYVLAALFFEPSTRTRLSFETAMHRLGGGVVGFSSAESTSVAKGETLADTIRMVDQYADVIAMRHPRIGSAREAAEVAVAPVLNGGDGAGQHPTQALLDLYTIRRERGQRRRRHHRAVRRPEERPHGPFRRGDLQALRLQADLLSRPSSSGCPPRWWPACAASASTWRRPPAWKKRCRRRMCST